MYEGIQWGIYGLGIMVLAMFIKMLITKKMVLDFIPASIFGFVCGGIGYGITTGLIEELYGEMPILTIVCLCLLGLGILGTALSIIFKGDKK